MYTRILGLTLAPDCVYPHLSAAAQLGLGPFVTAEIIAAADNADDHFPEVRALLLEACGITE